MPTAAWQLVETLRRLEVDRVFCVPGESYLPALDALTLGHAVARSLGVDPTRLLWLLIVGVALTVGLRRGGVIISLLVLPLYIPVLIFGTSAVQMSVAGFPVNGQLSMLAALLALALALAPLPTAAALRMSLS